MHSRMPSSDQRSPFDAAAPRDGAAAKGDDRHAPDDNGAHAGNAGIPPADLFAALQAQLGEARVAVADYFYTLANQARVGVRDLLSHAAMAIGALAGSLILAAVAISMLLFGLAGGLNALFDWPTWAGYLVIGLVGVVAPLVVALSLLARWKSRWLQEAKGRYDHRYAQHATDRARD
jgi:hypothetical protein